MRILIVAATALEIAPLAPNLGLSPERAVLRSGRYRSKAIDVLVTGVGMVPTAAWCAQTLARESYDLALNFGVCGSFDPTFAPGVVVHVITDRFPELGAEDGDTFLSIQQLGLMQADEFPFTAGRLVNHHPPAGHVVAELPRVDGITVNTVHGAEKSILEVIDRESPQVESMEGAAFMYACLLASVPFAQVRAVSNVVERRNKAAWKMPVAVESLGRTALAILDSV